jgi:hypothetical protein
MKIEFFCNPNGVVSIQPRVGAAAPTLGIRFRKEQPCKGWSEYDQALGRMRYNPFRVGSRFTHTQGSSYLAILG